MTSRSTSLTGRLSSLIEGLITEYSKDYVLLALKQISDRQLTYISFADYRLLNEPILKLLELIIIELETVLFDSDIGIESHDQLVEVIQGLLLKFFSRDKR